MTYFVFVESSVRSVPHMEALCADDPAEAMEEARRVMKTHRSAISAHVFSGGLEIGSVTPAGGTIRTLSAFRLRSRIRDVNRG